MEKGNSEEARVLAGPAACKRYSGPKPPSPEKKKKKKKKRLDNGEEISFQTGNNTIPYRGPCLTNSKASKRFFRRKCGLLTASMLFNNRDGMLYCLFHYVYPGKNEDEREKLKKD